MSQIFEVISGNITEGNYYEVIGGTSITYNSIIYNAGTYFLGITGVTTYTKTGGTEIVTLASNLPDQIVGIQSTPLPLFADNSSLISEIAAIPSSILQVLPYFYSDLPDQSAGYEDFTYYFEDFSDVDHTSDGLYFIPAETRLYITEQISQITEIIGTALYDGVTYDELLALELAHPEVTLEYASANNIKKIIVNGVSILIGKSL